MYAARDGYLEEYRVGWWWCGISILKGQAAASKAAYGINESDIISFRRSMPYGTNKVLSKKDNKQVLGGKSRLVRIASRHRPCLSAMLEMLDSTINYQRMNLKLEITAARQRVLIRLYRKHTD